MTAKSAGCGRNYPIWKTSGASKALCMTVALIIEDKAQAIATNTELIDKLHNLLDRFRIPKDQFYEVESIDPNLCYLTINHAGSSYV
jgi:hypothetical protein